jgi:hypothetical protein
MHMIRFQSSIRWIHSAQIGLFSAGLIAAFGLFAPAAHAAKGDDQKAWMEAKNVCQFPLGEGRMPEDAHELSVALNEGWKRNIVLPDPQKAVTITGGTYPTINTFRIDFSEGQLRPSTSKEKTVLNDRVEKNLQVEHLEVRGQPVLLQKSKLNMKLVAEGAQLDMERDRHGKPVMLLTQAKSGTLEFDVTRADAEALLLKNAREMGSHYGVTIEKIELTVVPETPRSVQATLYVETKVALIPAGMLFQAHVTIDNSMNAKISGLTCDGDEALGPLIVHFLRPSLARYNGKTKPLVAFPTKNMHLRDVAVRVDDSLHLSAAFGS